MDSSSWNGERLRVVVAKSRPALVLVEWIEDGVSKSVVKSAPDGVGVYDIPTLGRPTAVEVKSLPLPDLGPHDTLYVNRPVENAADIIQWFKSQGLRTLLTPDDMHVTVAFSKSPVYWNAAGPSYERIVVPTCKWDRYVCHLGPKAALVQKFDSPYLTERWELFRLIGASWDFPGYQPHVSLTYDGADIDPAGLMPWVGKIVLGPEIFAPVNTDWTAKES
jgi:hypothetical protein